MKKQRFNLEEIQRNGGVVMSRQELKEFAGGDSCRVQGQSCIMGIQDCCTGLSCSPMGVCMPGCEDWQNPACCTHTMAACGSRNGYKCTPGGICC